MCEGVFRLRDRLTGQALRPRHQRGQPWRHQHPSRCERSANQSRPAFYSYVRNRSSAVTGEFRHTKPQVPSFDDFPRPERCGTCGSAGAVFPRKSFECSPPGIHPIEAPVSHRSCGPLQDPTRRGRGWTFVRDNQNVVGPNPFPASAANVIDIVPVTLGSFHIPKDFAKLPAQADKYSAETLR